ncbi:MAG: hypothetical protein J6S08_04445 [Duodenibacillus sp.]|nr:hypothetical protein [Duodenibacillus sp.]
MPINATNFSVGHLKDVGEPNDPTVKATREIFQDGSVRAIDFDLVWKKPTTHGIRQLEPHAQLLLPPMELETRHSLLVSPDDGVASLFEDEQFEQELVLGLDVGTSSVKAVVQEPGVGVLAVPFVEARGIDGYLLPTRLYENERGELTLNPSARLVGARLKLDLMQQPDRSEAIALYVGFLALAIRHIRSWLFTRTDGRYGRLPIAWEVNVGCPSERQGHGRTELWKRCFLYAWELAETPGPLTLLKVNESIARTTPQQLAIAPYVRVTPEVQAEACGFVKNHPNREDEFYTLVDVGSGTLDVATFALTKGTRSYRESVTPYTASVKQLGTTNVHLIRLRWLRSILMQGLRNSAFVKYKGRMREWLDAIDRQCGVSLPVELPARFSDYFSGIKLYDNGKHIDMMTYRSIHNEVYRARCDASCHGPLSHQQVKDMPILLCGGGARASIYHEALHHVDQRMKNRDWLEFPEFRLLGPISDLQRKLPIPIEDGDYDRLLVAYGLAISHIDEVPEPESIDRGDQFKGIGRFISKDDV